MVWETAGLDVACSTRPAGAVATTSSAAPAGTSVTSTGSDTRPHRRRPTHRTGVVRRSLRSILTLLPTHAAGIAAAHPGNLVDTATDHQCLAVDQRVGHLAACRLEHPPYRLAGHTETAGGLFVTQAVEIDETQGLDFVDSEIDALKLPSGDASRLEQ